VDRFSGAWLCGLVAVYWGVSYLLRDSYTFLDEGLYLEQARLALEGVLPYVSYEETHLPGLAAVTALFFRCFGVALSVARLEMFVVGALLIVVTYRLSRHLGSRSDALAAATFTAIFGLSGPYHAFVLTAEPFMALLAVVGAHALIRFAEDGDRRSFVLCALAPGAALLFKQSLWFPLLAVPVFLALRARARSPRGWSGWIRLPIQWLALAAALPAAFYAAVAVTGHGGDLVGDTVAFFPARLAPMAHGIQLDRHFPLHLLPFCAVPVWLALDRAATRSARAVVGLYFVAGVLVAVPRFEFFHLLPALPFVAHALARTCHLAASRRWRGRDVPRRRLVVTGMRGAVALALAALGYFPPPEPVLFARDFDVTRQIAAHVATRSADDDRIFVFPAGPHISFFSRLRPATSHLVSVHLFLEPAATRASAQRELIDELRRDRPQFVVYLAGSRVDGAPVEQWAGQVVEFIEANYVEEARYQGFFPEFCDETIVLRRPDDPRGPPATAR